MDHHTLRDKVRKAMGPGKKLPLTIRDRWATFIKEERTEFYFRYEEIKDPRFYQWVSDNEDTLDIHDGQEWFGVYIVGEDGVKVNNYE